MVPVGTVAVVLRKKRKQIAGHTRHVWVGKETGRGVENNTPSQATRVETEGGRESLTGIQTCHVHWSVDNSAAGWGRLS